MNTDLKGTVKCPSSYFKKMAVVDYSNWKKALAREFFQNSIDAGSKRIDVDFDKENFLISIKDNGCGMTLDIILNKLLVLGASHKEREGSVGAFGKAKELLYFSWPSWSVETKGILVTGFGPDYSITKTKNKMKGVTSVIHVDGEDMDDLYSAFCVIADRMNTKSKIFINGRRLKSTERKGVLVRTFDFGNLYWNKSADNPYMSYKINGIWMFDYYLGSGKGKFTFDLTKSSVDLLTSNRDDLQWQYKNKVQDIVRELISERETMTKPKLEFFKEYFYGIEQQPVLSSVNSENVPSNSIDLQRSLERRYNGKVMQGLPRVSGYDKDFAILYTRGSKSRAKYFLKQKRSGTILKIWDGIINQVFDDNSVKYPYIVGFTFDPATAASISKNGVGNYEIYINPSFIGKDMPNPKRIMSNRLFLTEDLKDKAIHEIAHIYESAHNETFVVTMHKLRAATVKNLKAYSKIGRMK